MNEPQFSITNDTVIIVWDGKITSVKKGAANFAVLRSACINGDWDAVEKSLTVNGALAAWAKGDFTVEGDVIFFQGEPLPPELHKRISEMAAKNESPEPFLKFWARLKKNPSARSVGQLWAFLQHANIPIAEDGCFLAYKKVADDYTDFHTGTVHNIPGTVLKMDRNKISDDPREACHFGFHVGALKYAASDFHPGSGRLVIVKVDPEHVVSIPYDYSAMKMRVCEYRVEGHYTGPLSSTVHDEDTSDDIEPEDAYDSDAEMNDIDDEAPVNEEYYGLRVGKTEEPKAEKAPVTKFTVAKKWAKLQTMNMAELLGESIATLRAYAGKGLKIVGASKIPGGKTQLVSKIINVRNNIG